MWNQRYFFFLPPLFLPFFFAAIPPHLLAAVAGGIGLFIGFIGLKNAGVVVSNNATLVALGNLRAPGPMLALFGLLLIAGLFTRPAAFIASGQMAVAYWMFHFPASFYPAVNGGDTAILFSFVFLHIAAAGAGVASTRSVGSAAGHRGQYGRAGERNRLCAHRDPSRQSQIGPSGAPPAKNCRRRRGEKTRSHSRG